ncbi:MAG: hypothetical protein V1798_06320 [Pseudomonadota bacterium]
MGQPTESLMEFFRDRLAVAQKHQKLNILEVTQFYVVTLLSDFTKTEKLTQPVAGAPVDEPLALQFCRALQAPSDNVQYEILKSIGDRTLFLSGFFGDSLKRKIVDVDYYITMGEKAYEEVSVLAKERRWGRDELARIFNELSEKFTRLVNVLTEISEAARMTNDSDLLRLYERWLATKSVFLLEKLRENGILPVEAKTEPIH